MHTLPDADETDLDALAKIRNRAALRAHLGPRTDIRDGFTEYQGFPGPTSPRWGDYSAGVSRCHGVN